MFDSGGEDEVDDGRPVRYSLIGHFLALTAE